MPSGDNKCDRCGQWSGRGHTCPTGNAEATGGTGQLIASPPIGEGLEAGDSVELAHGGVIYHGDIVVRRSDSLGDDAITATGTVELDMAHNMAYFHDWDDETALVWLNQHQEDMEEVLFRDYGATLDGGCDSWDHQRVEFDVEVDDDFTRDQVVAMMEDHDGAVDMHNQLNGGFGSPNFWVRLRDETESGRHARFQAA